MRESDRLEPSSTGQRQDSRSMKAQNANYVHAYKKPVAEQVGQSWGGLRACRCECGDHSWAYPADDDREQWESVNRSMFRERLREAGLCLPFLLLHYPMWS